MKYIFIIILFVYACNQRPGDLSEQTKKEIINADIAMSEMASKQGFYKTLILYASDSVVKLNEGEFPVIGKEALVKHWNGKSDLSERKVPNQAIWDIPLAPGSLPPRTPVTMETIIPSGKSSPMAVGSSLWMAAMQLPERCNERFFLYQN